MDSPYFQRGIFELWGVGQKLFWSDDHIFSRIDDGEPHCKDLNWHELRVETKSVFIFQFRMKIFSSKDQLSIFVFYYSNFRFSFERHLSMSIILYLEPFFFVIVRGLLFALMCMGQFAHAYVMHGHVCFCSFIAHLYITNINKLWKQCKFFYTFNL